jgi:hypothetical protein
MAGGSTGSTTRSSELLAHTACQNALPAPLGEAGGLEGARSGRRDPPTDRAGEALYLEGEAQDLDGKVLDLVADDPLHKNLPPLRTESWGREKLSGEGGCVGGGLAAAVLAPARVRGGALWRRRGERTATGGM